MKTIREILEVWMFIVGVMLAATVVTLPIWGVLVLAAWLFQRGPM